MDSIEIGLWVTAGLLVMVLLGMRVAFAAGLAGLAGLIWIFWAKSGYAPDKFTKALVVSVMDRAGAPGVAKEVEGSGYGFRTVHRLSTADVTQPTTCRMPAP